MLYINKGVLLYCIVLNIEEEVDLYVVVVSYPSVLGRTPPPHVVGVGWDLIRIVMAGRGRRTIAAQYPPHLDRGYIPTHFQSVGRALSTWLMLL